MKDHLLHLFQYTRWANQQIVESLEALEDETVPERALRLLSHLLRSQQVWLGRIRGEMQRPSIWANDSLAECRERAQKSAEDWLNFLRNRAPGDFERTVRYENSKGEAFENELREIAAHVVNHSSHHRAQIAVLIREAGATPPVTDYIFWARSAETNPRHPLHLMARASSDPSGL